MPGERAAGEAAQIGSGAAALGVPLEAASIAVLLLYLERIYAWNRSAGLTTIARSSAIRLHLLDSLSIVPFLPHHASIVDLGTGAGLPGIPLALALPECAVTLVESKRKRCSFLSETVRDLGLLNCTVVEANARVLASRPERYDVVTGRAFLSPPELVEAGGKILAPGGLIVVMGARSDQDIERVEPRTDLVRTVDERITLPGGDERRRVVVFTQIAPVARHIR